MNYSDILLTLAAFLAGLVVLAFPLYPWLLRVLVALRGVRTRKVGEETPPVTLIVSAFNEEDVISEKIANARALNYPELSILVVSDASDDRTATR